MQTSNKAKPQGLIKAAVKYVVSKEYDQLKIHVLLIVFLYEARGAHEVFISTSMLAFNGPAPECPLAIIVSNTTTKTG